MIQASFSVQYNTRWGENLVLEIGSERFPMSWKGNGQWSAIVSLVKSGDLVRYRYLVFENDLLSRAEWDFHAIRVPEDSKKIEICDKWLESPVEGCEFPRRHQASRFDIPGFRGAGTAVPVFSLRTEDDFGIGDFRDLRMLVDWASRTGQCIIQLLPVNDTTRKGGWEDSYPYSPVSSFALNPMYIRLQDVGVEQDEHFRTIQKELNSLEEIDYPRVYKEKTSFLRKAYRKFGARDAATSSFKNFLQENLFWLEEYADFCARRDSFEKEYYYWTQFHLDAQFAQEAGYARSKGVSFKGDLPIGVSADSADADKHSSLFNLDSRAGAPPDFFSRDGQLWPFPTYNWEAMSSDGYAWWKSRLKLMSRYFDAFRIDHILGFFRIWEIPSTEKTAVRGHFNPALPFSGEEISSKGIPVDEALFVEDPHRKGFYHPCITPDTSRLEGWQKDRYDALYWDFFFKRHNDLWWRSAEKKLPELLSSTGMLACGEDLGMVPDCVQSVMDREKILSLEMSMMDKGRPWPRLSVCTTSSHDMSPLRKQSIDAGKPDPCAEDVCRILQDQLSSQSMLAIFPIQDWLAMDASLRKEDCAKERINDPANPDNHWCYRLHLNEEALLESESFNEKIREMIRESHRL